MISGDCIILHPFPRQGCLALTMSAMTLRRARRAGDVGEDGAEAGW